ATPLAFFLSGLLRAADLLGPRDALRPRKVLAGPGAALLGVVGPVRATGLVLRASVLRGLALLRLLPRLGSQGLAALLGFLLLLEHLLVRLGPRLRGLVGGVLLRRRVLAE